MKKNEKSVYISKENWIQIKELKFETGLSQWKILNTSIEKGIKIIKKENDKKNK